VDRDGRIANFDCPRVKTDEVANVNRFVKDDLFHRYGHESLVLGVPNGFDTASDVDVAQNNTAEDCTVSVRIARHHG